MRAVSIGDPQNDPKLISTPGVVPDKMAGAAGQLAQSTFPAREILWDPALGEMVADDGEHVLPLPA